MRDMQTILTVLFPAVASAVGGSTGNLVVSGIDRIDHNSLTLVLQIPADGGVAAANYYSLKIDHSDDNSAYVACTADDLIGPKTVAAGVIGDAAWLFDDGTNGVDVSSAAASVTLGYRGDKRYVRVTIVENGTTTGGNATVIAIAGHPRYAGD